jgi:hypothetical protein
MLQNADMEVSVHQSLRLDQQGEPISADCTQLALLQQHYEFTTTSRGKEYRHKRSGYFSPNTGSIVSSAGSA